MKTTYNGDIYRGEYHPHPIRFQTKPPAVENQWPWLAPVLIGLVVVLAVLLTFTQSAAGEESPNVFVDGLLLSNESQSVSVVSDGDFGLGIVRIPAGEVSKRDFSWKFFHVREVLERPIFGATEKINANVLVHGRNDTAPLSIVQVSAPWRFGEPTPAKSPPAKLYAPSTYGETEGQKSPPHSVLIKPATPYARALAAAEENGLPLAIAVSLPAEKCHNCPPAKAARTRIWWKFTRVNFVELDLEANPETCRALGVDRVPALLVFWKDGNGQGHREFVLGPNAVRIEAAIDAALIGADVPCPCGCGKKGCVCKDCASDRVARSSH